MRKDIDILQKRRQVYITNTVEATRQALDRLFRMPVLSFMLKRNLVTESPKYQVTNCIQCSMGFSVTHIEYSTMLWVSEWVNKRKREKEGRRKKRVWLLTGNTRNISMHSALLAAVGYTSRILFRVWSRIKNLDSVEIFCGFQWITRKKNFVTWDSKRSYIHKIYVYSRNKILRNSSFKKKMW